MISWFHLDESAKSKNPFKVLRMTQEKHFVLISQFTNSLNRRSKDVHDQPVHLVRQQESYFLENIQWNCWL